MDAEISPLDPTDVATMEEVQALRVAVDAADLPDLPPPCRYAFYGELTHPVSYKRREGFVARVDGAVAGYLTMVLPLRDNLDNAEAEMVVHPAHRRRGIGRALYTHQVAQMRELGRKRWTGMTVDALPGGRGHRLGMLLKVANLRFATEHQPELRAVDTWNAAVNRHMIAINEAIGFRPVDAWVNWQLEI